MIWPRDLLPDALDDAENQGRYLTFGYHAPLLPSDLIPGKLDSIAEELLDALIRLRGPVSFSARLMPLSTDIALAL